jgi:CRP/FNR family transcriptional regulator
MILAKEESGVIENDKFSVQNFLTHEDIAQLIGSSRQTVTTMLNELESKGFVIVTRQLIEIPSVKNLQKELGVF